MEQWFFKITAYAEKLLQNTYKKSFVWSEKVKIGQRNWIGKKAGINFSYKSVDEQGNEIKVQGVQAVVTCFTTRPETNI